MIPIGVLGGVVAGARGVTAGGRTLTYQGYAQDSTDGATFTFAAQPFGPADATRQIVVAAAYRGAPTTVTVTIGGVTATRDALARIDTNTGACGIFRADVPNAEAGDVVVTLSSSSQRCAVAIYALTGGPVAVTPATSLTNPGALDVTAPADGVAVAASLNLGTSAQPTWSGATSNFNSGNIEVSNLRLSVASRTVSAGAAATSATWAAATSTMSALAAYTPA